MEFYVERCVGAAIGCSFTELSLSEESELDIAPRKNLDIMV